MKIFKYYVDRDATVYSKETMNDLFWIRQALDTVGYDLDQDACYDMWKMYSTEIDEHWAKVPRNDPEAIISALVEDI